MSRQFILQNIIVPTIEISNDLINTLCENNYRKTILPNHNGWKSISIFLDKKKRFNPSAKNLLSSFEEASSVQI